MGYSPQGHKELDTAEWLDFNLTLGWITAEALNYASNHCIHHQALVGEKPANFP